MFMFYELNKELDKMPGDTLYFDIALCILLLVSIVLLGYVIIKEMIIPSIKELKERKKDVLFDRRNARCDGKRTNIDQGSIKVNAESDETSKTPNTLG